MFIALPAPIVSPSDHTVIWRYMDLPKFLSLLGSSALHLARLDRLIDRYEGTWPATTSSAAAKNWPRENYEYFMQTTAAMRAAHFVSCWCASPRESSSLWQAYAGVQGIAVVTTAGALKASIQPSTRFYLGQVEYLDFADAPPLELNLYRPVFLKRAEFESEREVRVLVSLAGAGQENPGVDGSWESVQLSVDLAPLLRRVLVAPGSPLYLLPAIKELLCRSGLPGVAVEASAV